MLSRSHSFYFFLQPLGQVARRIHYTLPLSGNFYVLFALPVTFSQSNWVPSGTYVHTLNLHKFADVGPASSNKIVRRATHTHCPPSPSAPINYLLPQNINLMVYGWQCFDRESIDYLMGVKYCADAESSQFFMSVRREKKKQNRFMKIVKYE